MINPTAGKQDAGKLLIPQIQAAAAAAGIKPVIFRTQYAGHARELAARYAASGAPARLYACGGDGTLNEVLQEVVGRPQLALGCVPCGSGNDYVRNFADAAAFCDIAAQLQGTTVTIDALSTSCGYGADICAAGLDAQVAYAIPRYRRLPGVGGSLSYTLAIVETVFRHIGHRLRVALDGPGGTVVTDSFTLLAVCNGQMYGGGYHAAPQARMNDGLLDVLLVKQVSRPTLARIIGGYKKGEHMLPDGSVAPKYRQYVSVFRARSVDIEVLDDRPLIVTLDGECTPCTDRLHLEVRPAALSAVLPRGVAQTTAPAL